MNRVSIREVAMRAGVSIATVSRVFSKSLYVSPELEERVNTAAKELGYVPNRLASSLRMGSSGTVGFIIPDIVNPFFSEIIKGAGDYLTPLGYILLLTSSSGQVEKEDQMLEALYTRKVDGFCAILLGDDLSFLNRIVSQNIPVVLLDDIGNLADVSYIASDNYTGMRELMDYLLRHNHKTFAYLGGKGTTYSAKERIRAFRDSVENREKSEIISGDYSYESGIDMVRKLKRIPDAVVCGNDMIAFGAMMELERRGYNIPRDVSVTGFDDLLFSKMTYPPLTTVRQDASELGRAAADLLLRRINGMEVEKKVLLNTDLQIRGSSRER